MRFEVSYPTGVTHEVQPSGPKVALGRDPGCDVVLNDTKCSRRHAIIEQVDGRLFVRDTSSANGIYVNGRRVDRAVLAPGDTVRLGDVQLRVLVDLGSTFVAAADERSPRSDEPLLSSAAGADPSPARAAPPPVRPLSSPSVRRASGRAGRSPAAALRAPVPQAVVPAPAAPKGSASSLVTPERPLTITLLAGLWALFVPGSVAAVLYGASRAGASPAGWALASALSASLAGFGVAMALGLRGLAPWAHRLQVAAAALGLVLCPFTLASITVLLYMTRTEVKEAFFADRRGSPGVGPSEPTFALSIVAMLGLGLAVAVLAFLVIGHPR